MALEKISIYFWEGMGELKPETCQFRMEVVINGMLSHPTGRPSYLRKNIKLLEQAYKVKLPKISWKAIVGDDDGGTMYKWVNKKGK